MAFTLAFTVTESGDNKTITITDTTGTGATGWGGANPAVSSIDSSTNTLTLDVDHINENWLDDRLENLRFLCPNCHSQFSRKLLGN